MPQPKYTLANITAHPAFVEIEADARDIIAQAINDGVINGNDPEEVNRACGLAFAQMLAADGNTRGPFFTALSEVLWEHLNPAPAVG